MLFATLGWCAQQSQRGLTLTRSQQVSALRCCSVARAEHGLLGRQLVRGIVYGSVVVIQEALFRSNLSMRAAVRRASSCTSCALGSVSAWKRSSVLYRTPPTHRNSTDLAFRDPLARR